MANTTNKWDEAVMRSVESFNESLISFNVKYFVSWYCVFNILLYI